MKPEERRFFQSITGITLPDDGDVPSEPMIEDLPPDPVPEKEAEEAPPETPVVAPRPVSTKNLFTNPDAHPIILDMALVKHLGVEWFTWLPETVFREIELLFRTSVADVNRAKIAAVMTLHITGAPWEEWHVFERVVHALQGSVSPAGFVHPPMLDQLYVGVSIMDEVRGETFSGEVGRYCAAVHLHEHVSAAVGPLAFCKRYLQQVWYRCKDCGNEAPLDTTFQHGQSCDACSGRYEHENLFSMRPAPGKEHLGKNLETFERHNSGDVIKRYEILSAHPGDVTKHLEATSEDVQAGKLIAAMEMVQVWQARLRAQTDQLKEWFS